MKKLVFMFLLIFICMGCTDEDNITGPESVPGKIYVANYQENTVSVIDGNDNSVITTIPVGENPGWICVNQSKKRIYVTNWEDSTVSVIDGDNDEVIENIKVGDHPQGIDINQKTNLIYVANNHDNTVNVIDGNNNTVIDTIDVGNEPAAVAVDSNTNYIYVANDNDQSISIINGDNDSIIDNITVGAMHYALDIDVNENTNLLYVPAAGGVVVMNNNGVTDFIDGLPNSKAACVNPQTNIIYVVNQSITDSLATVSVIDGESNSILADIEVGGYPEGIDLNPSTNKIYVAEFSNDTVSVIDGDVDSIIATVEVGSAPAGIGVLIGK
jgi:YVTN family beta-propeller protein